MFLNWVGNLDLLNMQLLWVTKFAQKQINSLLNSNYKIFSLLNQQQLHLLDLSAVQRILTNNQQSEKCL